MQKASYKPKNTHLGDYYAPIMKTLKADCKTASNDCMQSAFNE